MDDEDLEPQRTKEKKINLDEMSIEAIGEHVAQLEAEIERAKGAIKLKESAKEGAVSLFKS